MRSGVKVLTYKKWLLRPISSVSSPKVLDDNVVMAVLINHNGT